MKPLFSCALVGTLLASGCARSQTAPPAAPTVPTAKATVENAVLDNYIARPEPIFAWKETARRGQNVDLEVTSQTWQNIIWKHRVEIVRPARDEFPGRALVVLGYGSGSAQETLFSQLVANALGATVVNAWDIPNQPLFDKREDDLIAYTFSKYLETKDSTWPLLLPMTKSATQIMRAVAQWSSEEAKKNPNMKPLTNWVVSGASKRGWTTWLTAAAVKSPTFAKAFGADNLQVSGIIPMVYDNLDLGLQMPHQLESWGAYSEQIKDYARRGLPDLASTEAGRELVNIVDPWVYRARLDLPKLIINASNDPYWTLDSFNLYRNDLRGATNVFYAPNSGHALNGNELKVAGTSIAWFRALARRQMMPVLEIEPTPDAHKLLPPRGQWTLQVLANAQTPLTKAARIWFASSPTRDFRQSKWQSLSLQPLPPPAQQSKPILDRTYQVDVQTLRDKLGDEKSAFLAAFGEIELDSDVQSPTEALGLKLPFLLSSPVTIWQR